MRERHIGETPAARSVAQEHPIGIDDGQSGAHEICKVHQAFMDVLMDAVARAAEDSDPVLHSEAGTWKTVVLRYWDVDDFVCG